MEVRRYATASEFLDATKVFRSHEPIKTGLITSVATSVANGSRTYEGYFWLAALEDDEVIGVATRTIPYGYVFSPMALSAIETLCKYISTEDVSCYEFAGPKLVVDSIEKFLGKTVNESESELIYENRNLKPVPKMGEFRLATEADFHLVFKWMEEFIFETGLRNFNLENIVRTSLVGGRYSLLLINGEPVSLGGRSDLQHFEDFSIGRVGPIYTPKALRKRGYASSVTSEITELLINLGAIPMLYTQAENPTSNKIYQEIGYTLVDENRRIVFA